LYYSCYQRMLHIWVNVWGKDIRDIQKLPKEPKDGSHEQFINWFKKWLWENNYAREDRQMFDNIIELKKLRVKADYRLDSIEYQDCTKSQSYLDAVLKTLEKIR
jgi:hypothetical protein